MRGADAPAGTDLPEATASAGEVPGGEGQTPSSGSAAVLADVARLAAAAGAVSSDAAPLTRRQLRERAGGVNARRTADLEQTASIEELALHAVDDVPAVQPAVDVVEVEQTSTADPAEITVAMGPEADDAAFIDAVRADDGTHAILDEFEMAARLFAFTGETPVQVAAAAVDKDATAADEAAVAEAAPRRRRFTGAAFRRATAASASVGVMGIVGLLAVGLTTPAEAIAGSGNASLSLATSPTSSEAVPEEEIQAYVAPAEAQSSALERSDYSTAVTLAATPAQIAAQSGISTYSDFYTNDPDSAVQWPFAVGVSLSYGYGMRSGGMHEGLDFVPGNGAQIQAVADGTVRIATESGGGYGVMVIIDHVIDGELVSTRYGHMQYGSLQVATGDTVEVGQVIGLVGNTGHSFGAHLHFELLMNGTTAVDPLPWLREHAGG